MDHGLTVEHIGHEPQRWTWACLACDDMWPCKTARDRMLAESDLTPLRLAMWAAYELAAVDFPNVTAAALYNQFVRWTSAARL